MRILSRDRDMYLDLAGGNRIPKISERKARARSPSCGPPGSASIACCWSTTSSAAQSDLFQAVLTMLDPAVLLALAPVIEPGDEGESLLAMIRRDEERAKQLGRRVGVLTLKAPIGRDIVQAAADGQFDLIVLPLPFDLPAGRLLPWTAWPNTS